MNNGSGIPPTSSANISLAKSAGQPVILLSVPELLQKNLRILRLQGDVVKHNTDGSMRIKTSEGDIDISTRQKPLAIGTKIDIEIPIGSPPRNATIRPLATNSGQAQSPNTALPPTNTSQAVVKIDVAQPSQTSTKPAIQNQIVQKEIIIPPSVIKDGTRQLLDNKQSSQTPLSSNYQPTKSIGGSNAPASPPILTLGQTVRLTPLPLSQNQTIIPQQTQTNVTAPLPQTQSSLDDLINVTTQKIQTISEQVIKNLPLPPIITNTANKTQPIIDGAPQQQTNTTRTNDAPLNIIQKNNVPSTQPTTTTGTALPVKAPNTAQTTTVQTPIISKLLQGFNANIIDIKPSLLPQSPIISAPTQPVQNATQTPVTPVPTKPSVPVVTANVVGFINQNLPVLSIQLANTTIPQNFVLQFPATNISLGSQISLSPQLNVSNNTASMLGVSTQPQNLLKPLPFWPVFDEIFQTISQLSPPSGQMLSRTIPSPVNSGNLGAAALLFIAAMRSGDISGWLNDKRLDILTKAGKENLVRSLSQETSTITTAKTDTTSSEWRSYPIPMLWQNEISKVMLHIKHHNEKNQKNNGDGTTRFIMDISLTRMGDVQLDGFLSGNRLDLIVRTQMPISQTMQESMKRAYAKAMESTHIYGELGFQGDIKSWITVIAREENIISNA